MDELHVRDEFRLLQRKTSWPWQPLPRARVLMADFPFPLFASLCFALLAKTGCFWDDLNCGRSGDECVGEAAEDGIVSDPSATDGRG